MSLRYPRRESIDQFVACLASEHPLLVVLFGSVVSGEFTQNSDADVLAVFAEPKKWNDVYSCSDGWVQPVVMSLSELKARMSEGDSFVHEIVEEGELLAGSPDLWQEMRHLAHETQQRLGMKRLQDAWSYGNP